MIFNRQKAHQSVTSESGQIAVIILLLMVVLLTIGLSLAGRTTEELFLSQQQSDKTRIFNGAEAGIEEALTQDFDSISTPTTYSGNDVQTSIDDTTISYTITPTSSLTTLLREGNMVHVDLTGQTGTQLTIDWDRDTGCTAASLIASIYYRDETRGETRVRHETISPCTRTPNDNFTYQGNDINIDGYRHRHVLTVDTNGADNTIDLFLRIRAVYDDTHLRVAGADGVQLHTIRSTASNDVGDEQSVIEVNRTLETAPAFMDYSLYTGGSLVKN